MTCWLEYRRRLAGASTWASNHGAGVVLDHFNWYSWALCMYRGRKEQLMGGRCDWNRVGCTTRSVPHRNGGGEMVKCTEHSGSNVMGV